MGIGKRWKHKILGASMSTNNRKFQDKIPKSLVRILPYLDLSHSKDR